MVEIERTQLRHYTLECDLINLKYEYKNHPNYWNWYMIKYCMTELSKRNFYANNIWFGKTQCYNSCDRSVYA